MGKSYSSYKNSGVFLACLVALVSFFGNSSQPLASTPSMDWSPATLVETGTTTASSPKIAVDPNGNIMAVWVQYDMNDTDQTIYANRYVVGSGWGTATLLETSDLPVSNPRIAVDSNGNAIAVWQQQRWAGGPSVIYANRYVAGTGWGTVTVVYVDTTNYVWADDPQIAVDPNGNAMAVWALHDPSWSHTSVHASRYVVGTGWGAATNLSGEAVQTADSAKVALDSIGNAAVVWVQGFSSDRSIYANRYTVGTGWGTTVHIGTSPANRGEVPQIAFDPNGNAIAVWVHSGKAGISANRYVAGTGWGTAESIIDSGNTSYSQGVQIAFDKNGNAIAVWNQYGGKLYANRYVTGTGWGTTDIVDSEGQNYSAQIAFDSNGNAIAVWGKYESNSSNIWASRYVVGTGWGAGAIIHSVLDHAGDPQIVINKNGNATVVWVQGSSIFDGSIYASNGSLATSTPTPSPTATSTPTPTLQPLPSGIPTLEPIPSGIPTLPPAPGGAGAIFGFINDENDDALQGVIVTLDGADSSESVTTDEDGAFQFNNLAAGDYTLTCEKDGYQTYTQSISLGNDEVQEIGTIVLEVVVKAKISGYVVDINGDPIENVKIKAKGVKTGYKKTAASDADGFFEFDELDGDTYIIVAKKKGYKRATQTVKLDDGEETEIEVEMKKTSKRIIKAAAR